MGDGHRANERGRGVVVVLDDDGVFGELLSVVLAQAGFEPCTVPDGPRACAVVAERAADVVAAVCDLQLGATTHTYDAPGEPRGPGCGWPANGAEVIRALRDLAPDMTAVVMSGHPEAHVRGELAKVGADAIVLEKPFRPTELVDLLGRPAQLS